MHCCFRSSPSCTEMMTIEKAKEIAMFLRNNEIVSINVMGGEFSCNPNWYEILDSFLDSVNSMRLVSNSDWSDSDDVQEKLLMLHEKHGDKFYISLSNDKWHHNKGVAKAIEFLEANKFVYFVGDETYSDDNSIVPVGRSECTFGYYGMFSCYCHNPSNMYSFLIDEEGIVYKCAFGVWDYAETKDYVDGGFAQKFKEYNKKFYSLFISSCASCNRTAGCHGRTVLTKEKE